LALLTYLFKKTREFTPAGVRVDMLLIAHVKTSLV